jgi:hypothetical protein
VTTLRQQTKRKKRKKGGCWGVVRHAELPDDEGDVDDYAGHSEGDEDTADKTEDTETPREGD